MSNPTYLEKQTQWSTLYYSSLVGAKVVKVDCSADEFGDVWPKITFEKDGETFEVEVSQDEEGNGPGFLFGLAMPSDEENPFV